MKALKQSIRLLLIMGLLAVVRPAAAQTWTPTIAPMVGFQAIAASANGNILVAATINGQASYTSTNAGLSWRKNTWGGIDVALSADGTKLVVGDGDGGVLTSTNSGMTFTGHGSIVNADSVGSSADGSILSANLSSVSTNSGATWTQIGNLPGGFTFAATGGAISAGGTLVLIGGPAGNVDANAGLFISTNFGLTWITNSVPLTNQYVPVALSADLTKLVLATYNSIPGRIYTSTNLGVNWTMVNVSSNNFWQSVCTSADGNKLVAVSASTYAPYHYYPGCIYTSTNGGLTWTSNNVPDQEYSFVASSADGNKLAVVVVDGGIYTSYSTPSPRLNLTPSPTNLTLAWTVPSTNFVVQQSTNLTSWSNVTNPPVLNLTNLQNQVTLSPSNYSGFFRLKTP